MIKYYLVDDGSETSTLSYQKSEISPQHIIIVSVTEKKRESKYNFKKYIIYFKFGGDYCTKIRCRFMCTIFICKYYIWKIVQSCLSE